MAVLSELPMLATRNERLDAETGKVGLRSQQLNEVLIIAVQVAFVCVPGLLYLALPSDGICPHAFRCTITKNGGDSSNSRFE